MVLANVLVVDECSPILSLERSVTVASAVFSYDYSPASTMPVHTLVCALVLSYPVASTV